MWYRLAKWILAATQAEYLTSRGVSPEVITWYTGLNPAEVPAEHTKYVANALHKNPAMDLASAQNLLAERMSASQNSLTDWERAIIAPYSEAPQFQKWIPRALRKQFGTSPIPDEERMEVPDTLKWLYDWYKNTQEQISSYDFNEAIHRCSAWHDMIAGRGEGLYYEPGHEERIVFGPEWPNHPEWTGWTMQSVQSENDLKAEGNKLNHCVGTYTEEVKNGNSQIYSLRNPKNEPVATLEVGKDGEIIHQIFGHSNSEPPQDVKAMLRAWFEGRNFSLDRSFFRNQNQSVSGFMQNILESSDFGKLSTGLHEFVEDSAAKEKVIHPEYGLPVNQKDGFKASVLQWTTHGDNPLKSVLNFLSKQPEKISEDQAITAIKDAIAFAKLKDENMLHLYNDGRLNPHKYMWTNENSCLLKILHKMNLVRRNIARDGEIWKKYESLIQPLTEAAWRDITENNKDYEDLMFAQTDHNEDDIEI